MKLNIKNMVCPRCKMAVRAELDNLGLFSAEVELGTVYISDHLSDELKSKLDHRLQMLGFELIDDKRRGIAEKIKNVIIDLIHHQGNQIQTNLSVYLTTQLGMDYSYLSNLYSEEKGVSIEHYYIARVKELLTYQEFTLSEIAFQLNYSSLGHLSRQFKQVTGVTPSHYKTLENSARIPIDQV
jgi:AraC-like DNA-binding protein